MRITTNFDADPSRVVAEAKDHAKRHIATKNEVATKQAVQRINMQLSTLSQTETKQQSITGVAKEEMSDMMRVQQRYQANERVLSRISALLDTLIKRTGV